MTPKTLYARSGSINIAYQVLGNGPIDVVLVPGWVSNIEVFWEEPRLARWLRQIGEFARLILFDKRGTGMSDRPTSTPTLEERMDDVRAVMAATGSQSAVLIGYSEGGPMCALFAATYPERVRGVVMIGSYPRRTRTDDFPHGPSKAEVMEWIGQIEANWGTSFALAERAPSVAHDPDFQNWWARMLRMGTSPQAAVALTTANMQIDVRSILPSVRVPTLLIHAVRDKVLPVEFSRYMAARIPGARLLEINSGDHLPWLEGGERILAAIAEFVTGAKPGLRTNRMVCTIMFTDIVDSTGVIARHGDRHWNSLIGAHDHAVRGELQAYAGREINNTGDGFVAMFDGPARAIQCASAIRAAVEPIDLKLRFGLHSGECEIEATRVNGMAVHIASRISDLAPKGEIVVSRTVRDLVVGSGISFESFGTHHLKGVPDRWRLYRVVGARE